MFRREFIQLGCTLGLMSMLPRAARAAATSPMLVAIHLVGGNDSLNMVAPLRDPRYRETRPTLALDKGAALSIGGGLALHPALKPLLPLWERGRMAIVNGVGNPSPNRSHFVSSAAWHAGAAGRSDGWLGRTGLDALNVDAQMCPALWRADGQAVSVRADTALRLPWGHPALLDDLYAEGPAHLRETWHELRGALHVMRHGPGGEAMPPAEPGPALAAVLRWMPRARIYHTSARGYDTHTGQRGRHGEALGRLATALAAFWGAVEARGLCDLVTVLVYSEFGRRVEENASGGTDHGKAGAVLLLGGRVRAGLHGDLSLANLDDGDLRVVVDFRRVYADLLARGLELDPVPILGADVAPLQALR